MLILSLASSLYSMAYSIMAPEKESRITLNLHVVFNLA